VRTTVIRNHARTDWLMMPPWLWIYVLAYTFQGIPEYVSEFSYLISTYTGHGSISPQVTAQTSFTLLRILAVLAVMPVLVLGAGVVSYAFPHLRGRWVEQRFKLASDDRPVISEMQRFVSQHAPSVQLRVSVSDAGLPARIYPVGWRTARIAVFRPLAALWRDDRPAAEAVLLHEIGHLRQGDQLMVGLGSPFTWLIRIWIPAYILLALTPLAIYFAAGGGEIAIAVSGQVALQLFQIPRILIVPVTALWLAELGADQLAAQTTGAAPLQRALLRTARQAPGPVTRAFALLSHPPRRLRTLMIDPSPTRTAALLGAWPASLIAQLGITCVAAVPAYLLIGYSLPQIIPALLTGIHLFLADSRLLVAVTGTLLLAWPVLARPWERFWSPGSRSAHGPRWAPYLAAAAMPASLLLMSFVPPEASHASQSPTAASMSASLLAPGDHLPPGYAPYQIQNDEPTVQAARDARRPWTTLNSTP
jgi:Zn-dependent protease with chaperone function